MTRRSGRKNYQEYDEAHTYEPEVEEEPAEDDNEELEITRCVCGEDELQALMINPQMASVLQHQFLIRIDQGLFIQCDKCLVWQHGYCVGLFTNDEVPDKYVCEKCLPELHIIVSDSGTKGSLYERTLYKPVNDKRKKILMEETGMRAKSVGPSTSSGNNASGASHNAGSGVNSGLGSGSGSVANSITSSADSGSSRKNADDTDTQPSLASSKRKERRHYDDYDEQLQKALRESAKEANIRKRKQPDSEEDSKRAGSTVHKLESTTNGHDSEGSNSDSKRLKREDIDDTSNMEEEGEYDSIDRVASLRKRTTKPKMRKTKSKNGTASGSKLANEPLTKEEMASQPSKPRFVSDKSSIFELRKRTGAILEWLGRTQVELEDEKMSKIQLFNYKENSSDQLAQENARVINDYEDNFLLMQKLTEQILVWEQKYGKYAP